MSELIHVLLYVEQRDLGATINNEMGSVIAARFQFVSLFSSINQLRDDVLESWTEFVKATSPRKWTPLFEFLTFVISAIVFSPCGVDAYSRRNLVRRAAKTAPATRK